jgi:hypothetical protein
MLSHLFFDKIFKGIKDRFPEFLDDLSKNLDKTPKTNDIKSLDIEISSIKTEPKGFSIKFLSFKPDFSKEKVTFKDDEAILSFVIEGKNDSSHKVLIEFVSKIKELFNERKKSNKNLSFIDISEKVESNTLYLDFIIKISEVKWVKNFLKFNINFYEYEDVNLNFRSNLSFDGLLQKNIKDFFMELCSFIFTIKGEIKNSQYLLLSLLDTSDKYLSKYQIQQIKNFIYLILSFEKAKFNFSFIPEYLGNFIPDDKKKSLYEFIKELIPFVQIYNIYFKYIDISCINFDHILVSFLVAKYNSGFILDINLPGVTKLQLNQ